MFLPFSASAGTFDFQGLWKCEINGDPESTEYLYIKRLDVSEYFMAMCAPESHDNYGNSHALDFSGFGVVTENGALNIDTGETAFSFEPEGGSLYEVWNGYGTDRYFSRVEINCSELFGDEDYIPPDLFHNILKKIRDAESPEETGGLKSGDQALARY